MLVSYSFFIHDLVLTIFHYFNKTVKKKFNSAYAADGGWVGRGWRRGDVQGGGLGWGPGPIHDDLLNGYARGTAAGPSWPGGHLSIFFWSVEKKRIRLA